jgi:hypothetical protein
MKSELEILDAIKKVNSKKQANFFVVELSYNRKLVLPHDAGIAFINALKDAEMMNDDYGKEPFIGPLDKDSIRVSSLAHSHYEDIKVARLLNITLQELQDSRTLQQTTKEFA